MEFTKKLTKNPTLNGFVAGLLGALVMNMALSPAVANAARNLNTYFLVDSTNGGKGVETFVQDGQPGMFMYGEDGQPRIQIGTYPSPGERGLPLMGLSDNSGHLRMLFRLAGPTESPVIIMKDKAGHDRLVMGLDLLGSGNPFLSLIDNDGQKHNIFGTY